VKKAAAMGKALDEARDQPEEAMHDWETADEYVGMLRKR